MDTFCEWKLNTPSGELTFKTDFDLDSHIKSMVDSGEIQFKGLLPIPSLSTKENSMNIIEEIRKEATEGGHEVTRQIGDDPDDLETFIVLPDSIGVTRFLQEYGFDEDGSSIVTPFNEENWKNNKIEEYIKEGKTREEAEELIKTEMASWPKMSEMGTEIHSLFEWVFNGEEGTSPKCKYLSDDLKSNTISQAQKFKQSLQEKYKDCVFYTELPIKSDDLTTGMKAKLEQNGYSSINGKIDLLVVDKNGEGHIYDFKVSRKKVDADIWDIISRRPNKIQRAEEKARDEKYGKNIGEHWWHSTKKEAASHQLAMYSAMLEQKGIHVKDANIVPVHTTLTYEDPETQLSVNGIKGVEVQMDPGKIISRVAEVLSWGKYATSANQVFRNPFTISGDTASALQHIYSVFFPKNATITDREHAKGSIENERNNPNTVITLKPSDKKYQDGYKFKLIRRKTDGKVLFAKTEEELTAMLTEYINDISGDKAKSNIELADRIEAVLGGEDLEELTKNIKIHSRAFLHSQFDRYIINNWDFRRDDSLNALGIFIFSKGDKIEIVTTTEQPIKNTINLGKDKFDVRYNILGATKKDRVINKKEILSSTGGHMELMKAMAYISLNADKFKGKQIAELRVINVKDGSEDTVENSKLINNYNKLCQENPSAGAPTVSSSLFMNDVEAYILGAKERMEANHMDFDGFFDANQTAYTAEWIKNAMEKLRTDSTYGEILYDDANYNPNDPIWHAYVYLNKAYLASQGYFSTLETDIDKYSTGGLHLDGLRVSSMQYSPSANIRTLGEIINKFANAIRKKVFEDGFKMAKQFEDLYSEYGTGAKIFKTWLETDADGNIRKDLHLKDPDDPEFAGAPKVRAALDTFLKTMAKLRWGEDVSDSDIAFYKENGQYYELPLTEAVASRQLKNLGLPTMIKNKIQQYTELTEDIFAGSDINVGEYATKNKALYNKFALTGKERMDLIEEKGINFFETDMESVFNQAIVAYTKSNLSKDYIPMISALKLALTHTEEYGGSKKFGDKKKVSNIVETFDDLVKSKVYGETIITSKSGQTLYKVISVLKAGFTTMTLSLNVRSFLRESLQGIWTGISRSFIKTLPGIDNKTYKDGLTHVIQEAHKNISGVSKLQQLNQIYAMANQSLSQVASNRRVNWLGINHWGKDTLFLTATAPDFMHRVSILVAKMMGDGCWEAHSLNDEGKLVYDFKKDKRFEAYTSNDTSNKDYLKQKSLYLTLLEEFNKEGVRNPDGSLLKEGDALPQAYTSKESQSIKNYADLLYGHYDDESRSLICDGLIGSIFLQYKTYLTAKLEQWTMTGGVYNTETIVQQKDPFGKDLYEIIRYDDKDENENPIGMPHRDIISEEEYNNLSEEEKGNARLYFDYQGIPMEGMLNEHVEMLRLIKNLDSEGLEELWKDPNRRGYFLLGLHDMWLMALMQFLLIFVLGNVFDIEHKDGEGYQKTVAKAMRDMDPGTQLMYNVLIGSMADSQLPNIINSFTDKPPILSAMTRFGKSSWQLATGNSSLAYYTSQNFGMFRDFQGIAKRALEEK